MNGTRKIDEGTRCIVYTRVSTTKQAAAEKASLDDQLAKCRALAKAHGHDDPAVWDDPGKSGTDPRRLDALVEWCEAHPRDGLVVAWSPDRFARIGSEVVGYYTVRLRNAGWDLRYVDMKRTGVQMVDGVTGALRAEIAAEESRIKRERSLMGGSAHAAKGRWNGGNPPFGYVVGPDKHLALGDTSDVKMIRLAFAMYAKGETLNAVAKALGRNPSGARHILANPVYIGAIEYGRRKGSAAKRGGMEKAHEPIVDGRTWAAVQDRLRSPNLRYAHGGKRLAPKGALPYVLSKLVRCTCTDGDEETAARRAVHDLEVEDHDKGGSFLVGGGGVPKKATEAERLRWRRYQCKTCRGSVRQAALETAMFKAVAGFFRQADKHGELTAAADRWVEAQLRAGGADEVAKERAAIETKLARARRTALETDDPGMSAIIRGLNERIRELNEAGRAKPDAKAVKAEAERIVASTRAAVALGNADNITAAAANASLARLRPLITEATWDRERRTVTIRLAPWAKFRLATSDVGKPGRHSGSSAPWRARASRRAAKRRI